MKYRLIAVLFLIACAACPWPAQILQPGKQTLIVKNVNNVPLTFLALDKHNHFVSGLEASQIQIFDNQQPQRITHFDAQGNLPLRIVLLLDISNSITTRWAFEQRAATDFLQSVLVEGRDQAMVAGFDTSLHVAQPFTDNYEKLAAAIRSLNPSGGTALFDALFQTAHDDLGPGAPGSGDFRNVVVIISDGADDQSRYSREEALGMAEDAGAIIYTIGTEPTGSDAESDAVLKRLSSQTGGLSFFPIEAHDLGAAFQAITSDLRHQYVVTYDPNNFVPNGEFHTVEIKIAVKGVTARTRKGYFARPAAAPAPGKPGPK
ncbi:MAG TPA: VWA domain-containing protein [Terriglobales bacterium]|nr:VWA domain-containing protein [Terriglobales bacterium]